MQKKANKKNIHGEYESPCLTLDQMMDYSEQKMSEKERAEIKMHLQQCDLCRDAVDGLAMFDQKSNFRHIVNSLDNEIDSRSSLQPQLMNTWKWKRILAVAALFMICVLSFFYVLYQQEPHEKLFAKYFESYDNIVAPIERGKKPAGRLHEAMQHYEMKSYNTALPMFHDILAEEPENLPVHFYSGIVYLSRNDNKQANRHFLKVIKFEKNDFQEPAKWYLGLSYLQLNELEKARSILNQLISTDSYYKDKATTLLLEMKSLE